jgi:hemolysin activation/secretion protein
VAGQWTAESLLGLEQMSIGGRETVRGYRENQLVRDTGIAASVEFRIPVLFDSEGAGIVHLAPFFDFGGGWNVNGSPKPTTLSSAGVGLLANPWKQVAAELYWGHPFRDIDIEDDNSAQDLGLHFRLNISAF